MAVLKLENLSSSVLHDTQHVPIDERKFLNSKKKLCKNNLTIKKKNRKEIKKNTKICDSIAIVYVCEKKCAEIVWIFKCLQTKNSQQKKIPRRRRMLLEQNIKKPKKKEVDMCYVHYVHTYTKEHLHTYIHTHIFTQIHAHKNAICRHSLKFLHFFFSKHTCQNV